MSIFPIFVIKDYFAVLLLDFHFLDCFLIQSGVLGKASLVACPDNNDPPLDIVPPNGWDTVATLPLPVAPHDAFSLINSLALICSPLPGYSSQFQRRRALQIGLSGVLEQSILCIFF